MEATQINATHVTIHYKAFGDHPERGRFTRSVEVPILDELTTGRTNEQVCDVVYHVTNLQDDLRDFSSNENEFKFWKAIESVLPADRTHTSLSVNDEVTVTNKDANGSVTSCQTYRVSDIGWQWLGGLQFESLTQ